MPQSIRVNLVCRGALLFIAKNSQPRKQIIFNEKYLTKKMDHNVQRPFCELKNLIQIETDHQNLQLG